MGRLFSRLALLGGVVAVALVASSGPAYRYAEFDIPQAFMLMRFGVYAAGVAAALSVAWLVAALVQRSASGLAGIVLALLLAAGAAYIPVNMQRVGAAVPSIHDITTDFANPPKFVELADLRAKAPNGADYKTDVSLQQKAYPDIQPLISSDPADVVFERALKVAHGMKWHVVSSSREELRIEATDTTPWFGFKDDVVIRITAGETGCRLDMRSMSRVGKSDLGKNATRIREFMKAMKAAK